MLTMYYAQTTVRGREFVTANPTTTTTTTMRATTDNKSNNNNNSCSGQQYLLLRPPASLLHAIIAREFRLDSVKTAALHFHPYWLLGDHDAAQLHHGAPFVHRDHDRLLEEEGAVSSSSSASSRGNGWHPVSIDQVREILDDEGPKNLLLLPPLILWDNEPPPPHDDDDGPQSSCRSADGTTNG
jgi:hypothetical protein